jgi:hypothetical protein
VGFFPSALQALRSADATTFHLVSTCRWPAAPGSKAEVTAAPTTSGVPPEADASSCVSIRSAKIQKPTSSNNPQGMRSTRRLHWWVIGVAAGTGGGVTVRGSHEIRARIRTSRAKKMIARLGFIFSLFESPDHQGRPTILEPRTTDGPLARRSCCRFLPNSLGPLATVGTVVVVTLLL